MAPMRRFIALSLLAAAAGRAHAQTAPAGERVDGERVNVVLIVWNEVPPPEALSGNADPAPRAPALAALAAKGALFVAGSAPLPRGKPALASLVTGRYPHQNGIYFQNVLRRIEAETALVQRLKDAGYATLQAGRFAENKKKERYGFDRVIEDPLAASGAANPELERFVAEFGGKQPLFVWWSPESRSGAPELDRGIVQLVRALEAADLARNTLFCFVADEAPAAKTFSSRDCTEAKLRTPLLFALEGRIAPAVRRELATLHDVHPTILDYAGVAPASGTAGRSLRPLLEGRGEPPRTVCGAFYPPQAAEGGGRGAEHDVVALTARDARWKYVLFLDDVGLEIDRVEETVKIDRSAGDQSLYDLEQDPEERRDLFGEPGHEEVLAELRQRALDWWRESGGPELRLPYLPPPLGPAPKEPRPNIVLVISDDHDYEHLGFLGNERARTPTIDALARSGVVFPVAHVPMSRCRPSLAALLSGRWPHQTGIYDNETSRVLARSDSLPNLLKAAGYACFQGGKFWEGSQFSMGFLGPELVDAVFRHFVRDDQDELFAFIDEHGGERPLFLWWAPMLPHGPFDPPERHRAPFRDVEVPVPPWIEGDPQEFVQAERTAFAMEAWLDEGLAALCAKLKEAGLYENTLVLFLIDNGYANGFPSKGSVFEKGLRTPVFACWPAKLAGGRTSDALVSTVDLYATILDYAGVAVPASAQGRSLRPALEGGKSSVREALYGAVYRYRDRQGRVRVEKDVYAIYARTARWKYVLYLRDVQDPEQFAILHPFAEFPARARGDRDLFDLDADPYEQRDLSADPAHAERMAELQAGILAWWRETGGGELDLP